MNSEIDENTSLGDSRSFAQREGVEKVNLGEFDYVMSCLPGIAVAGLLYPIVFCSLAAACQFVSMTFFSGGTGFFSQWDFEGCIFVFIIVFAASVLGMAIGLMSGIVSLLVVTAINQTIGRVIGPVAAISCAGGLAGFLPTSLVLMPEIRGGLQYFQLWENVLVLVFGPFLAMIVGQTGARWWERTRSRANFIRPLSKHKVQFKIGHILVATLWCGLLLGSANALSHIGFGWIVFAYIFLQIILLAAATCFDRIRSFRSLRSLFRTPVISSSS